MRRAGVLVGRRRDARWTNFFRLIFDLWNYTILGLPCTCIRNRRVLVQCESREASAMSMPTDLPPPHETPSALGPAPEHNGLGV